MTDLVELILVDGPGAGQRIQHHLTWAGTYLHVTYPDWPALSFDATDTMMFAGPDYTSYRVGHAFGLDGQIVCVGWSSGEPRPDPEDLEYWIRYEPPVKVVAGADAIPLGCDNTIREDQSGTTVQGVCLCGWETEAVPRRRTRELMELVYAHRTVGLTVDLNFGVRGVRAQSISQATRFDALLIRAVAVGMSRERAQAIYHDAEAATYGFDDAIARLEHCIRRFAMYGYLPLAVRDVLTAHEIDEHWIDPEAILNRPRWMPDPLGLQFAEMTSSRQRSLVMAALTVTDELGGDANGWPLERAIAAVMPHVEAVNG